jgi:glycerol kinase
VDALLVHHLTGGASCATDPTNASRTMLYDVEERRWSDALGALLGVDPAWLPEVRGSTALFGEARRTGVEGLPIHGLAGDQQAALFGQGAFDPGGAKLTYGTGCFLLVQAGERRPASSAALLTTLGVDRAGHASWVLEGSVFAGGSILQWLRDGLGILERAADSEALARSVPDAAGVVLVPAFTGLGAPYWDPDARAALLGMTRGTTRAHLARAALEAIALQCAELVECVREDAGLALEELRADGGASANALLLELQADLAGLAVLRPADVETTALGAARLAGLGAGLWMDPEEPAGPRELGTRFRPRIGPDERERRLGRWRRAVARVRGPLA